MFFFSAAILSLQFLPQFLYALKHPIFLKKSDILLDTVDVALDCSTFHTLVSLLILKNPNRIPHPIELVARSVNVSVLAITHHFRLAILFSIRLFPFQFYFISFEKII
jgi:hypothetical protein